jgi:membrane protease YdiL (CAAX protease family)
MPPPTRRSRALTVLSAAILISFVVFLTRLHTAEPRLAAVAEPERALALLVGRTMDVETALTAAPAWERRLYALTLSDSGHEINQAIAWYEELADYSLASGVDLRLAVLRGEAGRGDALRQSVSEWEARGEPLSTYADVLAAAYLGAETADSEEVGETLGALGTGWFADALALRLSARLGEPALGEAARRSIASRAGPLLWKLRALTALDIVLLVAGLLAMGALRRRPPEARVIAAAQLPPPWRLGAGLATLVRGGAVSALALIALLAGNQWLAERPLLAETLDAPVMYLPVVLLAWRVLVVPSGTGLIAAFGLVPRSGGWRPLALAAAALVAAGAVLDVIVGLGGSWLGFESHWAEWFDADLAWGPPAAVALTMLGTVVLAPVFEELIFRGLLYGTLRVRLGPWLAALVSAAIFAFAHGYGAAGFVSVFVSGVLWAWAYERTGSLLPSMAAHVANNAAVGVTFLWLLR